MAKKLLGIFCVLALAAGIGYADDPETVDLYVTPGVTVSLLANPTYYNFGTVDLNSSSAPAAGIFTLQNDGDVAVTATKQITTNPSGWDAITTDPNGQTDKYRLYLGTSSVAIPLDGFNSSCVVNDASANALTGAGSSSAVSIAPSDSVEIHAQIDMPQYTSTGGQKKIVVSFDATAQ